MVTKSFGTKMLSFLVKNLFFFPTTSKIKIFTKKGSSKPNIRLQRSWDYLNSLLI